jgi:hypothetical protein
MFTMALGLSLMGMTYGPIGTVLSELFPTSVRYTGSSLTFNFAGIFFGRLRSPSVLRVEPVAFVNSTPPTLCGEILQRTP